MLRYKTETRPALVALYDIRPGNGAGQFLQPRSPHRLGTVHTYTAGKGTPLYHHLDHRHNLDHSQYLITYPLIRKCICVVSCPYVIYYPTVMARNSLFVLKVPLNPKQTNKQTIRHSHKLIMMHIIEPAQ